MTAGCCYEDLLNLPFQFRSLQIRHEESSAEGWSYRNDTILSKGNQLLVYTDDIDIIGHAK